MTNAEKEAHEFWETTNGYLKEKSYHEAWEIFAKKNPEIISDIKTWENFDAEIFKEITGLTV